MLFDAFRAAQWDHNPHRRSFPCPGGRYPDAAPPSASGVHPTFLSSTPPSARFTGPDGKPFKTRSGDTVKLKDLLLEAIERAGAVQAQRAAELSPEKRAAVNRAWGSAP